LKGGAPPTEVGASTIDLAALDVLDSAAQVSRGESNGRKTFSVVSILVGKLHLTEMVDPNYVVIAAIDKKYLPTRK
jgi:hypothetical protein